MEIQLFQQMPYCLRPVPELQAFLQNPGETLSEKEMYELSLICEPRT